MRIERRSIQRLRPVLTVCKAVLVLSVFAFLWTPQPAQPAEGENATLQERIELEMRENPFVSSEDISVRVDQGVVELRGAVRSITEKAAAAADAYQAGAERVRNLLEVRDGIGSNERPIRIKRRTGDVAPHGRNRKGV